MVIIILNNVDLKITDRGAMQKVEKQISRAVIARLPRYFRY